MMDGGASQSAAATAQRTAIRRLHKDLQTLQSKPNRQLEVRPLASNLLEWHFIMHDLPDDTPYKGGCYHGKIMFPPEYPHAPPTMYMITPSGRVEVNKRLCLSMTDFHPESWNPAWSTETILVGFLSYFISDNETGYGSIQTSEERRVQLAGESWQTNRANAQFAELFPEFLSPSSRTTNEKVVAPLDANQNETVADVELVACTSSSTAQDLNHIVGSESQDAALAPAADEEGEDECWICRDTMRPESLIRPCACRGSMSGVHTSCVEEWIAHHRRTALDGHEPRCGVCHQEYCGQEERPGVLAFARHACGLFVEVMLRSVVLFSLLYGYQTASSGDTGLRMWVRILLITAFALASLHKLLILCVSLPMNQAPPQAPPAVVQHLWEANPKKVSMHAAEAAAAVMVLGMWCAAGTLAWPFYVPLLVATVFPVLKYARGWQPSWKCLQSVAIGLAAVVFLPLILVGMLGYWVYRHPKEAVHPLGAGWHVVVAIASVPLLMVCKTNVPVLLLWSAHLVLVAGGLVESAFVKRLEWIRSPAWWVALQMTALAAFMASSCTFSQGLGAPDHSDQIVACASFVWLTTVGALTVSVNREFLLRTYRAWQNRNGRFTLNATVEDGNAAAPDADAAARPARLGVPL
mmetsp:Transcript_116769/g.371600  ORF Transcript_116769/g.371600 Transcript_116769/m.371600 type:complete len:637 (-) Transcript_116769:172-2082(-)|eukprot:CAMPEP_0203919764 /NCGR_PEP_ID=MMETSP0359-20131031/60129_1 /ASSEMBLY_ACC=CAM_ASM_000338 /TAXON_ID=268821 /ORGANISM="Scrippsiella Hangoei, Strain SHTV-5" /LENGTH=636 /DNA_ID=CAMNT_0050847129 /DNA_START=94 /DNA_END=2004 /DNA_ORIENTATION=+